MTAVDVIGSIESGYIWSADPDVHQCVTEPSWEQLQTAILAFLSEILSRFANRIELVATFSSDSLIPCR